MHTWRQGTLDDDMLFEHAGYSIWPDGHRYQPECTETVLPQDVVNVPGS